MLVDTNILTRAAQPLHPHHATARSAIDGLLERGTSLCVGAQSLYEFWVVATRATEANGLGMDPSRTALEIGRLRAAFTVLFDSQVALTIWQGLVATHEVRGKSAHDARLVSVALAHGLREVLTFNGADFRRYAELTVVDPASVVARR